MKLGEKDLLRKIHAVFDNFLLFWRGEIHLKSQASERY